MDQGIYLREVLDLRPSQIFLCLHFNLDNMAHVGDEKWYVPAEEDEIGDDRTYYECKTCPLADADGS